MTRTSRLLSALAQAERPDPPGARYLARRRLEIPHPVGPLVRALQAPRVRTQDRRLPTPGHAVRIRVYRPVGPGIPLDEPLPLVVNLHGGGFVFGSLDAADWLCGQVASGARTVVVSVDYRLAPEHPAPVPYEDALAATCWLLDHADEVGADPARASVLGESAGGNLAALITLALRDRARRHPGALGLVSQVLLYPATDLTLSSPSVAELPDMPILKLSSIEWYGRQYLPQGLPTSIAGDDPRVSPLHAADLSDLPPALVVAAGRDPLRDDATRYGDALAAAGVDVVAVLYPRALHGFAGLPLLQPAARAAVREIVGFLTSGSPQP